jgi:hypothetical protein
MSGLPLPLDLNFIGFAAGFGLATGPGLGYPCLPGSPPQPTENAHMKYASTFRLAVLAVLLGMTSLAVMAAVDPQQLTIRDIVTQQTQLRAQVTAGKGAFKDMSKAERAALAERQDRVLQMLGGSQSLEEMQPDQRTAVFNDLEWIKAAVSKAEDERKVCEYTRAVGSNRMTSVCMTAKAQRENREATQQGLRNRYSCNLNADCKGN